MTQSDHLASQTWWFCYDECRGVQEHSVCSHSGIRPPEVIMIFHPYWLVVAQEVERVIE